MLHRIHLQFTVIFPAHFYFYGFGMDVAVYRSALFDDEFITINIPQNIAEYDNVLAFQIPFYLGLFSQNHPILT